jgi:TetR/AcrR family transcriptional regulator, transcriptional repressor for nem operon
MRYTSEQKQQTAANMLDAAGRSFRIHGYGGAGVDGLAKEAGVTSGAFYKHFASKASAFDAAIEKGFADYKLGIEACMADANPRWLEALTAYYFSEQHRTELGKSCVVPGLAGDAARGNDSAKQAYEKGLIDIVKTIEHGLPDLPKRERTERAWVIISMLMGGVLLARAVKDTGVASEITHAIERALFDSAKTKPRSERKVKK